MRYPSSIGGISTLDSFATVRALDEHYADDPQAADRQARVEMLAEEFKACAADCQADQYALFAPRVRGGLQTMADLVTEEFHYRDFGERAVEVLLKAAAGKGTQREAQQLLDEIAAHWADTEVAE